MMSLELYVEIGRSLTTKMLSDSHEGTHEKKAMKMQNSEYRLWLYAVVK